MPLTAIYAIQAFPRIHAKSCFLLSRSWSASSEAARIRRFKRRLSRRAVKPASLGTMVALVILFCRRSQRL